METLNNVIFYHLERAIKTYRQFAQNQIKSAGLDITVDQWLVLKTLSENEDITQNELADRVFKDKASITRIIDLLISGGYLSRKEHPETRRRFKLIITKSGKELVGKIKPVVVAYRKKALKHTNEQQIKTVEDFLKTIITNCNK